MLLCIRSSRSKIISYLAPVQLFTQLPCQTPAHLSLKSEKPLLTLPRVMHERSLIPTICHRTKNKQKIKMVKNGNLVKWLVLNSFVVSTFQKILHSFVKDRSKLYTCRAIKLTQGVRLLRNS